MSNHPSFYFTTSPPAQLRLTLPTSTPYQLLTPLPISRPGNFTSRVPLTMRGTHFVSHACLCFPPRIHLQVRKIPSLRLPSAGPSEAARLRLATAFSATRYLEYTPLFNNSASGQLRFVDAYYLYERTLPAAVLNAGRSGKLVREHARLPPR